MELLSLSDILQENISVKLEINCWNIILSNLLVCKIDIPEISKVALVSNLEYLK
jgi:hypothetical protein